MRTILDQIFEVKRERVREARRGVDLAELAETARNVRAVESRSFRQALQGPDINIIAEFKRASPSKGMIDDSSDVREVARSYEIGGARAISVLTEEDFFKGSLDDLRSIRAVTSLPILRKDFIYDEFQIYEAAIAGADAILLIASSLENDQIRLLRKLAEEELGIDALVEVHTVEEMERVGDIDVTLIGINNRDLRTFKVSLDVSRDLAKIAPPHATLVSESGLRSHSDLVELKSIGFSAFLIGERLMTSGYAESALRELTGKGNG